MPPSADAMQHGHRGTRAIQRMVEYAPASGSLALWVHHRDLSAQQDAALVHTDGHTVFYSPAFATLPLEEQTGLVAHEVLHIALRHAQRYTELQQLQGDVDLQLFNLCADAIVNSSLSHLAWLRLPAGALHLPQLLASALQIELPVEQALLEWDVERLYRAVDDRSQLPGRSARSGGPSEDERQAERGRGGGDAQARTQQRSASGGAGQPGAEAGAQPSPQRGAERGGNGPRATRIKAGASAQWADLRPGLAEEPQARADNARLWAERLLRAHAGDGAYSMLRSLLADIPASRTPWELLLRTRLARALAPQRNLSWSRPSRSYLAHQGRVRGADGSVRRMPWEPGHSASTRVPRLALVVDVSGSIDADLLQRFSREVEGICRRLHCGAVLVIGDDRVRQVRQLQAGRVALGELSSPGGGGTDFTPLLQEAERHRPDITVVLTDLDGPARHRPRGAVLWAVPRGFEHLPLPFGRRLVLQ